MAATTMFKRVQDLFCRRMVRMRDLKEISLMDARELADLGLRRSDASAVASGAGDVRDRIAGMTARLGLDYGTVMESHWRAVDIARNCAQCGERRACRRYLAGHGPRADYQDFCPNARTFAGLVDATRH
jgi:uncharacterized protein YjiS (DUF1127 family)